MKITVYYEDKTCATTLEVPDADCEIWVETDYQQRLAAAEDKAAVTRRTPQEIMDEECNKPTFNSHQRETRRHVSIDALDPQGDTLQGTADVETGLFDDDYVEVMVGAVRGPNDSVLLPSVLAMLRVQDELNLLCKAVFFSFGIIHDSRILLFKGKF